jgi:hypothetical protein
MLRHAAFCALLAAGLGVEAQSAPKALKIALTKTSVKKGALRSGLGISAEIPAVAWQAKVAGETLLFLDLNGDDMIAPETDGLATSAGPFVVPLPDTLLLKTGQYKLAFDGVKELVLTPEDLGAAQQFVAEASLMTELRIRSALRPAALDAKACADCLKHIEYMKLNGLADGSGGMAAHKEEPGKPGYTPEGAEAGARGDLFPQAPGLTKSILGWYQSVWHCVPIVDPGLTRFGTAIKYNVAVLYFNGLSTSAAGGNQPYPPDGATNIPRSFGENGEMPNPVPGTQYGKGCGLPVFVRTPSALDAVIMTDAAGRSVAGTFSCVPKPATKDWPTNSGVACFIPAKPLAPTTTYKVTFKFEGGGEPVAWSFTTSK